MLVRRASSRRRCGASPGRRKCSRDHSECSPTRRGWLDGATPSHDYTITLVAGDQVSVAATDNDTACRARIEVFPPLAQRHFRSALGVYQPVFSWDDGAPLNHIPADTFSAGGHFEAATGGVYRIRVQPQPDQICPWYRLHIAKVYPSQDAMPPW